MVFTLVAPFTIILLSSHLVACTAVNRTIDDQRGDSATGALPSYSPSNGWTAGDTCNGCNINRTNTDVSKAFDQTWSDSTYHPGQPDRVISMSFVGTDVYVFNTIVNQVPWTTTLTNLTLSVDGTHVDSYLHSPDLTSNKEYQVMILKHNNMQNVAHNIEIRATGSEASLILFDYVMYTFEDDPPTISSPTQNPPSTSPPSPPSSTPPSSSTGASSTPPSGSSNTPSTSSSPSTRASGTTGSNTQSNPAQSPTSPSGQSSSPSSSSSRATSSSNAETTPDAVSASPSPPDPATPVAVVVGGALGGVALVAIAVIAFCVLRKRRRTTNARRVASPTRTRHPSLLSSHSPATSPTSEFSVCRRATATMIAYACYSIVIFPGPFIQYQGAYTSRYGLRSHDNTHARSRQGS